MIGTIAFKFLSSTYGRYIVLALAVLSAIAAWGRSKRKSGKEEAVQDQIEFVRDRTERGRDAYHESRRKVAGDDVSSLIDGMRSRDSHWGRLPDIR
jgi:hypothetical protein